MRGGIVADVCADGHGEYSPLGFRWFVIVTGILIDAEFLCQDGMDVARTVQHADNLDAVGNGSVEDAEA